MKTEPSIYSIMDIMEKETDSWEGVRNFQVRNYIRDTMKKGDRAIIYHSGKTPEAVGLAVIAKNGYPDHHAFDKKSRYYDPASNPENPTWFMVDIKFESMFKNPVTLRAMKNIRELENMTILKRGNRLSITPLSEMEFEIIVKFSEL